jgi:phosphatidylglycerophosphate synthase
MEVTMSETVVVVVPPGTGAESRKVLGLTPLERVLHELRRAGVEAPEILRSDFSSALRQSPAAVIVNSEFFFRRGALAQWLARPAGTAPATAFGCRGRMAVLVRHAVPALAAAGDGSDVEAVDVSADCRRVGGEEDVEAGEQFLLDGLRKPLLVDGLIGYYMMRPITLRMTRLIAGTGIRPNHVTALCMALGLVGAALVGLGHSSLLMKLGLFLFFFGVTLDCVDGELSRLKYRESLGGAWFDTLSDDLSTFALFGAMGVYLSAYHGSPFLLVVGWVGAGCFLAGQAYAYYYLLTVHRSGDVLDFVWVFQGEKRRNGGTTDYLLLFTKRDFFSALILICGLLDVLAVSSVIVCIACMCFILVVMYDVVMRLKARAGRQQMRI